MGEDSLSSSKEEKCPVCGEIGIPIVYGLPGFELQEAAGRGEVVIGGCVIFGNDPDHQCRSCEHTWRTGGPDALDVLRDISWSQND